MSYRIQQFFWVGLILLAVAAGFGFDYWAIDQTSEPGGREMHPGASIFLVACTAFLVGVISFAGIEQISQIQKRLKNGDTKAVTTTDRGYY